MSTKECRFTAIAIRSLTQLMIDRGFVRDCVNDWLCFSVDALNKLVLSKDRVDNSDDHPSLQRAL